MAFFELLQLCASLLSYTSLLIQWIRLSGAMRVGNQLQLTHKLLLLALYVFVATGVVATLITYAISTFSIALIVGTAWNGLYGLLFPIPLTIYGLKLYCTLRIGGKSFTQYKVCKQNMVLY